MVRYESILTPYTNQYFSTLAPPLYVYFRMDFNRAELARCSLSSYCFITNTETKQLLHFNLPTIKNTSGIQEILVFTNKSPLPLSNIFNSFAVLKSEFKKQILGYKRAKELTGELLIKSACHLDFCQSEISNELINYHCFWIFLSCSRGKSPFPIIIIIRSAKLCVHKKFVNCR